MTRGESVRVLNPEGAKSGASLTHNQHRGSCTRIAIVLCFPRAGGRPGWWAARAGQSMRRPCFWAVDERSSGFQFYRCGGVRSCDMRLFAGQSLMLIARRLMKEYARCGARLVSARLLGMAEAAAPAL